MTRLTDEQERRQALADDAIMVLDDCDTCLRFVELRTRQAIELMGFEKLLSPIFGELNKIRANIARVREMLRADWKE